MEEELGWSEWNMPRVVEQKEGWGEERMNKVLVSLASVIPLNYGLSV